jgi:hypothetical protein
MRCKNAKNSHRIAKKWGENGKIDRTIALSASHSHRTNSPAAGAGGKPSPRNYIIVVKKSPVKLSSKSPNHKAIGIWRGKKKEQPQKRS